MKGDAVVAVVILILGIIFRSPQLYIGMFTGSILSIFLFYLLCMEIKKIVALRETGRVRVMGGYLFRYGICGIYLGIMGKFFGADMIICSAIGLLNTKFNIQFKALSDKYIKFRDKHLK